MMVVSQLSQICWENHPLPSFFLLNIMIAIINQKSIQSSLSIGCCYFGPLCVGFLIVLRPTIAICLRMWSPVKYGGFVAITILDCGSPNLIPLVLGKHTHCCCLHTGGGHYQPTISNRSQRLLIFVLIHFFSVIMNHDQPSLVVINEPKSSWTIKPHEFLTMFNHHRNQPSKHQPAASQPQFAIIIAGFPPKSWRAVQVGQITKLEMLEQEQGTYPLGFCRSVTPWSSNLAGKSPFFVLESLGNQL